MSGPSTFTIAQFHPPIDVGVGEVGHLLVPGVGAGLGHLGVALVLAAEALHHEVTHY